MTDQVQCSGSPATTTVQATEPNKSEEGRDDIAGDVSKTLRSRGQTSILICFTPQLDTMETLKSEIQEIKESQQRAEAEVQILRATILELKAEVDNARAPSSNSATQPPTTSSSTGSKEKRKGDDDEIADQAAKNRPRLFHMDQRKELEEMAETVELMRAVVKRIVPREDLWDWNQSLLRKSLFGLLTSRTRLRRLQSFMNECDTKHWHCLNCIIAGEDDTAVIPATESEDDEEIDYSVGCWKGCEDCVYLARVDMDGAAGSRYYYARYVFVTSESA
jgi:hypothetical protein